METAKERFAVYSQQTKPLIQFYKEKGILHTVDGNKEQDAVLVEIDKILKVLAE